MTTKNTESSTVTDIRTLYEEARLQDHDRALCTMFAPAERRPELLGLLLLAQELARITDHDKEPMLAMMRFQWWRDALGGASSPHPVLVALRPAIGSRLHLHDLLALLEAREAELDWQRPQTLGQLEEQVAATAGTLQRLAAGVLGETDPARLRAACDAGTAYGLVGTVRSHTFNLGRSRNYLPEEFDSDTSGQRAIEAMLKRARAIIGELRSVRPARRDSVAAFLPATVADAQARALLRGREGEQGPLLPLRLLFAAWLCQP